ncbi:MAG TPA: signal peptidase I [Candidatus Limnocylindrales bacterium]|nr:signal peptidase I [Candidatus Limnocylindrales bacterium]
MAMTGVHLSRRQLVMLAVATVLFLVWALVLRPTWLGGPAGYIVVAGSSMEPTLAADSVVLTIASDSYSVGDVIAFRAPLDGPAKAPLVIHRIVGGSAEGGYRTRGDNMSLDDPWLVRPADVVGRQVLAGPGLGPVLVYARSPLVLASVAAGITLVLMLGWMRAPVRPSGEQHAERNPLLRRRRAPLANRR